MSELLKWLDDAIAALREQLRKYEELRAKLIAHPEFDAAASGDADRLIRESMPDGSR